jgi:SAM-dependent methyltransferase
VSWRDVAPLHATLEAGGLTAAGFDAYVARTHDENQRRVREGDLDHLVSYLLQSTQITAAPAIEPALSAKRLVEAMEPARRAAFLRGDAGAVPAVPGEVTGRITALLKAVSAPHGDARLTYFASLVADAFPERATRQAGLAAEYLRVMRFLYRKEFVAQQEASPAAAVAELYRHRGLSTDTAVEAGYVVQLGLGVLKGLDPDRRVRRVLIVGPGLDLAPRTGLQEAAPPESYQPWAVIDALVSLGLGRLSELDVAGGDINPRVVTHLREAAAHPPALHLLTSLHEGPSLTLSRDYVEYVDRFGAALVGGPMERAHTVAGGQRAKTVAVTAPAARALRAETLDIVTERLDGAPFDLIIATNILPYFDDTQLALALSNIAAMLAPGGVFVHNEQRPVLGDLTAALGLPLQQSRHAVIATVAGAKAPLYDSVFLHVRQR